MCDKVFCDKSTMSAHVRTIHKQTEKPFGCDACGAKFKTKGALGCHEAKHNESKSKISARQISIFLSSLTF